MTKNIDVAKLLQNLELTDLNQVTALSQGLKEMVERRTKLAISEYEQKLKFLKDGTVPPEALVTPTPRTRARKKKETSDDEMQLDQS